MIIAVLILLGLCFGSFVNAFVWRLYQQALPRRKQKAKPEDLSISKGRSMCVNCGHTLKAMDLLPVVSWLSLRGKCRYCHKSISWQYPLVELVTAVLFVGSYIFWPRDVSGLEIAVFGTWLVCLISFMALIVYDIRWMLLPNKIVFPMYSVAALFVLLRVGAEQSYQPILTALFGVLVGGGIFYLLFQISGGTWIGGGDVKLGFLLGALVGGPVGAFLMLFVASLLGTLVALPLLAKSKVSRQARIPFGPFLIVGAIIVQLFDSRIVDSYLAFTGLK